MPINHLCILLGKLLIRAIPIMEFEVQGYKIVRQIQSDKNTYNRRQKCEGPQGVLRSEFEVDVDHLTCRFSTERGGIVNRHIYRKPRTWRNSQHCRHVLTSAWTPQICSLLSKQKFIQFCIPDMETQQLVLPFVCLPH